MAWLLTLNPDKAGKFPKFMHIKKVWIC